MNIEDLISLWDEACGEYRAAFYETPTEVLEKFVELVKKHETKI